MKIGLLGSAPSSVRLAPYGDASWQLWGCSPGVYAVAPRVDAWFELHRWEPGQIGKPDTQKPWLSPEYVAWMSRQRLVWMANQVPEIPGSRAIPIDYLSDRYGTYFWTSSVAYMLAMAIDMILEARKRRTAADQPDEDDQIGLWGVDMAATEEYGFQRAGCQHFICMANQLGIGVIVPPESDLLRPSPMYGLCESEHWHIKLLERRRELQGRLNMHRQHAADHTRMVAFIEGALDDMHYHMETWSESRDGKAPAFLASLPPAEPKVRAECGEPPSQVQDVQARLDRLETLIRGIARSEAFPG